MTALFWPLPIAILSQLQKVRLIFPFSYRFVITRPVNEFKLLPSDLVFCAIPFDISCYKKETSYHDPYETVNIMSLTSEAPPDRSHSSTVGPFDQKTPQASNISVHSLESKPLSVSDSKRTVLTQNDKASPQTHPGETVEKNGKENMTETIEEAIE